MGRSGDDGVVGPHAAAAAPGALTTRAAATRGLARRLRESLVRAGQIYVRTECNQRAAAIAYRVLFSLVPFVALLASLLELLLPDTTADRVAAWAVDRLPLPADLEASVSHAVKDAGPPASVTGLVSLVVLLYASSGMTAAIRSAFRAVWATEARRPYLRAKLLDAALVLGAGLLVVCAFALTVVLQLVASAGADLLSLGNDERAASALGAGVQVASSVLLTFTAFLVLYRFVPTARIRLQDAVAGALVACVGFQAAAVGLSIYLDRFAGFDDVYGTLGAVLVFLFLVYGSVAVLLLGAGVAAEWPKTAVAPPPRTAPPTPLRRRLVRAARGLVVGEPPR
jgi:membrane protein